MCILYNVYLKRLNILKKLLKKSKNFNFNPINRPGFKCFNMILEELIFITLKKIIRA